MPKRKRRKAPSIEDLPRPNPYEEYEWLQYRAVSDRIHRALTGRLTPSREQIVDKLNQRRKT